MSNLTLSLILTRVKATPIGVCGPDVTVPNPKVSLALRLSQTLGILVECRTVTVTVLVTLTLTVTLTLAVV